MKVISTEHYSINGQLLGLGYLLFTGAGNLFTPFMMNLPFLKELYNPLWAVLRVGEYGTWKLYHQNVQLNMS